MEKKTKLITLGGALLSSLILFWIFCVNHVNPNEVGVAYNKANGKMEIQGIGWHVTAPWVKATTVYDYPFVIDVTQQTNTASPFNLRLLPKFVKLRLNKEYIEEFFQDVGFQYLFSGEQLNIMRMAYFQEVTPKWLEVLEK